MRVGGVSTGVQLRRPVGDYWNEMIVTWTRDVTRRIISYWGQDVI